MANDPKREIVRTDNAPQAIGPYSQAVRTRSAVYTAGQIGLDPATGSLVDGGVAKQTRQVLTNLRSVLEAAGTGLSSVVKTTVYLADINDFAAMNAVYGEFFAADAPARSTVAVASLPKGALVEIDAFAAVE